MIRSVFRPGPAEKGRILVLSGLDGTGKSTQAEILARRLASEGVGVGTVWNRWKPLASAPLIYLARRRLSAVRDARIADYRNFTESKKNKMRSPAKRAAWQTMVWIEYAVEVNLRLSRHRSRSRGVICDRYVYDTVVDMAVNFSMGPEELHELCENRLLDLFPVPSRAILIDIDPRTGSERKNDGTPEEYLADRRELYLEMARLTGAAVIDGRRSVEEIAAGIWDETEEWRSSLAGERK